MCPTQKVVPPKLRKKEQQKRDNEFILKRKKKKKTHGVPQHFLKELQIRNLLFLIFVKF